ncbi:MAG: hypothetical protein QOH12_1652 [Solirubrobacteraceae bacterium]|jgi:lipoprotein-anchoring transpeptidase ErfK/SrfK|nr:hypothetical protein [Solirubrobacteraceae bacterium]
MDIGRDCEGRVRFSVQTLSVAAELATPPELPRFRGRLPFWGDSAEFLGSHQKSAAGPAAVTESIFTAPVGIGRRSSPTPAGHFWIREGFPVVASARAAYGPYALGTSAYSVFPGWPGGGVIGIHGSSHPIVGPSTSGCVTLRDDQGLRLASLVSIGTPVWVK